MKSHKSRFSNLTIGIAIVGFWFVYLLINQGDMNNDSKLNSGIFKFMVLDELNPSGIFELRDSLKEGIADIKEVITVVDLKYLDSDTNKRISGNVTDDYQLRIFNFLNLKEELPIKPSSIFVETNFLEEVLDVVGNEFPIAKAYEVFLNKNPIKSDFIIFDDLVPNNERHDLKDVSIALYLVVSDNVEQETLRNSIRVFLGKRFIKRNGRGSLEKGKIVEFELKQWRHFNKEEGWAVIEFMLLFVAGLFVMVLVLVNHSSNSKTLQKIGRNKFMN